MRRVVVLLACLALTLMGCLVGGCVGEDGLDGAAGADGMDGVDGIDGEDGTDGNDGEDGANGADGDAGADGDDGDDGQRGSDCWDLNENGVDDPEEDTNGDGSVNILDCTGADGEDGEDGEDWSAPYYVGSGECLACHEDQYEMFVRSGHPYKLIETGGMVPTEPWDGLGNFGHFAPAVPTGYDWADVQYVIGGWGWKQRFVDLDGYIFTGSDVQYNLSTGDYVAYHDGEAHGTKPYDCGSCHTTGYQSDGNQNGLPGITGTWDEPGVHCEECHGNGSQHIADPYLVSMEVDRSAELCGSCHYRTDPSVIPASNGFIKHHEQWNELFHSKKHSMDCIDCHNPHQSAKYEDATWNPNKSIRISCEACHYDEEANQDSVVMASFVECIDCHMPYATKSAVGDTSTYTGDLRTHLFGINTDPDAEQFNEAGDEASPYLTLGFSCRSCHRDGGTAVNYTDEELAEEADGYHD